MATHGTVGEFQPSQEDWTSYVERLQQYFTANDVIAAEKQRAILLSAVGASTYRLIRSLLAPAKPTDHPFKEIVAAVQAHHQPPPSMIVERFHFHSRSQREGESVSVYGAELHKLSKYCEFGATLADMGYCAGSSTHTRLLAEPGLPSTTHWSWPRPWRQLKKR